MSRPGKPCFALQRGAHERAEPSPVARGSQEGHQRGERRICEHVPLGVGVLGRPFFDRSDGPALRDEGWRELLKKLDEELSKAT
jgi:hypothetical protein